MRRSNDDIINHLSQFISENRYNLFQEKIINRICYFPNRFCVFPERVSELSKLLIYFSQQFPNIFPNVSMNFLKYSWLFPNFFLYFANFSRLVSKHVPNFWISRMHPNFHRTFLFSRRLQTLFRTFLWTSPERFSDQFPNFFRNLFWRFPNISDVFPNVCQTFVKVYCNHFPAISKIGCGY